MAYSACLKQFSFCMCSRFQTIKFLLIRFVILINSTHPLEVGWSGCLITGSINGSYFLQTAAIFISNKKTLALSISVFYSLTCPTVATPHKFHKSFWQVFDKFDGSHDKNFLVPPDLCLFSGDVIGYSEINSHQTLMKPVKNLYKTYAGWPRGWTRKTVKLLLPPIAN